jgi:hypothetical protein
MARGRGGRARGERRREGDDRRQSSHQCCKCRCVSSREQGTAWGLGVLGGLWDDGPVSVSQSVSEETLCGRVVLGFCAGREDPPGPAGGRRGSMGVFVPSSLSRDRGRALREQASRGRRGRRKTVGLCCVPRKTSPQGRKRADMSDSTMVDTLSQ